MRDQKALVLEFIEFCKHNDANLLSEYTVASFSNVQFLIMGLNFDVLGLSETLSWTASMFSVRLLMGGRPQNLRPLIFPVFLIFLIIFFTFDEVIPSRFWTEIEKCNFSESSLFSKKCWTMKARFIFCRTRFLTKLHVNCHFIIIFMITLYHTIDAKF